MITVKAFCQKYDVTHQTVYKKIKRKQRELDEHIFRKGRCMILDEYAENLLKPYRPEVELEEKLTEEVNRKLQLEQELENARSEIFRLCEKAEKLENEKNEKIKEFENAKNEIFQLNEKIQNLENEKIADFEKQQNLQNVAQDKKAEKKKSVIGKILGEITKK